MNTDRMPAFPRPFSKDETHIQAHPSQEGMELRDYFAAQAIVLFSLGDKEIKRLENGERLDHRSVAACCYGLADAMMEERLK